MRVHMRSVMEAALERGVVMGYHTAHKTADAPHNHEKTRKAVNVILSAIWDSVDEIIDFSDDDDDKAEKTRSIGFKHTTDLVGSSIPVQAAEEDEEEDFPFD